MKIKFVKDLTNEESSLFKSSELYNLICSDYLMCDIHQMYYKEYFGVKWQDFSIVAYDNELFYAAVYIYSNLDDNKLTYFGFPCKMFRLQYLPNNIVNKAYQEIYAKIKVISTENEYRNILIEHDPLLTHKLSVNENFKLIFEYNSNIDLSLSENEIKANVRKSYKSLINWGKNKMDIKVYDYNNINPELMEEFENFHIKVAKRRTRSHESWMMQYEAVKQNMGYVVNGYYENELVSSVLVLNGKEQAYYGVAVNNRDLMSENRPIGHAVLMEAIYEAKRKGMRIFHLGNVTPSDDKKINDIAKYKKGFSSSLDVKLIVEASI